MEISATPETWQVETKKLSAHASKGAAWVTIGNVSVSAIRFIATAILARMLLPGDFGLVGMGFLFVGMMSSLGAIGFSEALIYQRDLDNRDLSTAFWTTLFTGTILTGLSVVAAPIVVWFFGEPLLAWIVPFLGLIFVLKGLGNTHAALLSRILNFGTLAKAEIAAALIRSAIMIAMAVFGMGLWSIVWGLIAEQGLKSLLIIRAVGWMPRTGFRTDSFAQLFHFGRNVYGDAIVQYFNRNLDFLIVGRMLGAAPLAFYQFAYNIPHLVTDYVAESADRTTFSLYSRLQDRTAVRVAYLKTVRLAAVLVLPAMLGLSFVADEVIALLYGSQWSTTVPPLRVLCFAAAVNAVFMVNRALVRSQGRPDLAFKWSLILLPSTAALVFWGSHYGLVGVALAMLIVSLASAAFVWRGLRLIGCTAARYLTALTPGLASAVLMLTALWGIRTLAGTSDMAHLSGLAINLSVGFLVFVGSIRYLFPDDAKDLWNLARRISTGLASH